MAKKRLILSPSQIGLALDCNRKWWMERVARLGRPRKLPDPRTFGDVLHEVAGRFLSADHLGRDVNFQPVDLYPKDWKTVVSQWGEDKGQPRSVTVGEGELIQKLISAAIEQGILARHEGGKVESRFDLTLAKTDRGAITVMGYRDYIPDRCTVEDHKTCKVDKTPWRKSPLNLYRDIQMRCYGYSLIGEAKKRGEVPPPRIHLVHNQFVKDPDNPVVRRTRACDKNADEDGISRQELETWWTSVVEPLAHKLLDIREVEDWHNVDGPPEGSNGCNKYGGCPYMNICCGMWSIERYKKRLARKAKVPAGKVSAGCQAPVLLSPTQHQKEQTMGFAEKLAAKKAKKAAMTASKKETPKTEPKAEEPKPETPKTEGPTYIEGDTPPWASSSCRACGGKGFSTRGAPCRICDAKAAKAGKKPSSAFEVIHDTDTGVIVWSDGETEGSVQFVTEEVEVKEEALPPTPKEEPAPEPEKPSPKAKAKEKAKQAVNPKPDKKGRGRPPKGFTLLIDCVPTKGLGKIGSGKGVIHLDEVIARYGAAMAADMEADSFYSINAFDRRDALCKVAEIIAAEFTTDMVIATTQSTEERELLKALRPLANTIIVGTK